MYWDGGCPAGFEESPSKLWSTEADARAAFRRYVIYHEGRKTMPGKPRLILRKYAVEHVHVEDRDMTYADNEEAYCEAIVRRTMNSYMQRAYHQALSHRSFKKAVALFVPSGSDFTAIANDHMVQDNGCIVNKAYYDRWVLATSYAGVLYIRSKWPGARYIDLEKLREQAKREFSERDGHTLFE